MNPLAIGDSSSLRQLINFDVPDSKQNGRVDSTLFERAENNMQSLWRAEQSDGAFNNAFGISLPADERNEVRRSINPTEYTTIPIVRFRHGWESGLTRGNLAFAVLTSPGLNTSNRAALLCTLPVANWTLQMGQLSEDTRATWEAGGNNPYNQGTPYDQTAFLRKQRNFADSELYLLNKLSSPELGRIMSLYGVVQHTTGIDITAVTAVEPRSSMVIDGLVQTHHLWNCYIPGTRLYLAFVRMPRSLATNAHLLDGPDSTVAPPQVGASHMFAEVSEEELHPYPYVLVPCWTSGSSRGSRFEFHPAHRSAIDAAEAVVPGSGMRVISVGNLVHAPQYRPDTALQVQATFDGRALARLPFSTVSFHTFTV
jgi:hypothetical protein